MPDRDAIRFANAPDTKSTVPVELALPLRLTGVG